MSSRDNLTQALSNLDTAVARLESAASAHIANNAPEVDQDAAFQGAADQVAALRARVDTVTSSLGGNV